jgi:oligoendopeptidase F
MVQFKQTKWDLSDVLEATKGPKFDSVLSELNTDVTDLEKLRDRLKNPSSDLVLQGLKLTEKIIRLSNRLQAYAYMWFSENTSSQEAKAFMDKIEVLITDIGNKTMFFNLWWIGLDDKTASQLMPGTSAPKDETGGSTQDKKRVYSSENADYRFYLGELRKLKPHTLDEKVEQVINLKNITSVSAWTSLYDQVTNKFTYVLRVNGKTLKDEKGRTKQFTDPEVTAFFPKPDPERRLAAYHALLSKHAENIDLLGEMYKNIVKDWMNDNVKIRNYTSPIAARNLRNGVSDAAVDALLSVCRENVKVFQDFFKLKAKILGVEKLRRYDIYALPEETGRKMNYSSAVELVLDTFESFDPKFGELARNVFEKDHVDSEVRVGKQSGAYNMSVVPGIVPFIKLSYADSLRDVFTIAHESGHGIHAQLSSMHSVLVYEPSLTLAETASVFGEMVLSEKLLDKEKDNNVRREMLLNKIGDLYATIQRQAYFVIFEKAAHEAVSKGATTNDLSDLYLSTLREQFGDAVDVPEEFKHEWSVIPHIYHTPFYCYAYAFGGLLTLSLYKMYKEDGEKFKPKLFKILSAGGSETPENILKEAGIDIKSKQFWQGGFDVLGQMMEKLKALS